MCFLIILKNLICSKVCFLKYFLYNKLFFTNLQYFKTFFNIHPCLVGPVDYPRRNDAKLNDSAREPLRSISPPQTSHQPEMTQVAMPEFDSNNHAPMYVNGSSSNGSTAPSLHDFSFGTPKEFNVPGLKLPALATVQIDVREVRLKRNAEGR